MLRALARIPGYRLSRAIGYPQLLPMNLTLSVSYACNSRCRTCNIYKKKAVNLSVDEWNRIFENYGRNLFWATISGGEPFLREDLADIVCALYDSCGPSVITIPTNGLLSDRIPDVVERIAKYCRHSQVVINISIDDIGERHDDIRGVQGSYERAGKTFHELRAGAWTNVSLGIHTVISRYNVKRIPEIFTHLSALNPDSYISEIAEERRELDTVGSEITPGNDDYAFAVDYLSRALRADRFNKVGKVIRAFRLHYYAMVKRVLREHRQVIPCYAGIASGQIAPDGDVWMCCIKADPIGNLRDAEYDFSKIWFSPKAHTMRKAIKRKECYCPLANASYTNMLHDPGSLLHVAGALARMSVRG